MLDLCFMHFWGEERKSVLFWNSFGFLGFSLQPWALELSFLLFCLRIWYVRILNSQQLSRAMCDSLVDSNSTVRQRPIWTAAMIETFCQDVYFSLHSWEQQKSRKLQLEHAHKHWREDKNISICKLLYKVSLTGCWLIWPSGRSIVDSCHPVCVGGTQLPLSCPEPWPSSTCSRPHSCRCHCGHRSQPGCPSNTQKKRIVTSDHFFRKCLSRCTVKDSCKASSCQNHPKLDVTVS